MRRFMVIKVLTVAIIAGSVCGASWAGEMKTGPSVDAASTRGKIEQVKVKVARDPKDRKAWVQLGNLYFDSGNRKDAIEAYQKALDLKGDDPDVLCDQGIMYEQLGDGVKAAENFEKALAINPKHPQSLFNAGRVANERLNQPTRALYYWKRLVQADPANPNVKPIKSFIDRLEKDLESLKGTTVQEKEEKGTRPSGK